jgi:arylsulfatase A-like enzyme
VLFMPETLRADAVMGERALRAKTPCLDEFSRTAVSFENVYVNHTVCSPSRCSMFTGLYPHTRGHRTLDYLLGPHERNLFMDLKEAGYTTICFGKNDFLSPDAVGPSFDSIDYLVWPDEPAPEVPWPKDHKHYKTFYYGKKPRNSFRSHDEACIESALKFLENPPEPFCLFLPISLAHPPYYIEEPFFSMHGRSDVPMPIPPAWQGRRRYARMMYERYGLNKLGEDDFREIKATYFGMVSKADHLFGQVLDKLKTAGVYDRTATIFFSDHGDFAGDYGLVEKWWTAFEEPIIHTPLMIRLPGENKSLTRQAFVEMIDFYPTVLEIAQVRPRHYQFGKSLVGLLNETTPDRHRDAVFAEGGHNLDEMQCREPLLDNIYFEKTHLSEYDPKVIAKAFMVRTEKYKYIYSPEEKDELYDVQADPDEMTNLAERGKLSQVVNEMKSRLMRWFAFTADTVPLEKDPRGFLRQRKVDM